MDTIGNLLTSLRNAEMAGHTVTTVPASRFSLSVLAILKENSYIKDYVVSENRIDITLNGGSSRHSYRRISKPGRRLYVEADRIPSVRSGTGMVILSTSKGVLSGKTARKEKLGGELLCEVY